MIKLNKIHQAALIFCLVFVIFTYAEFQADQLPKYDAYYHAKMAEKFPSGEFFSQQFPWLSQTVLAQNYGNMHFLFHVFLSPFTILGFTGMKLATILLASLFFLVFFLIAYEFSEEHAFLGTLLIMTSAEFLFRLLLPRAISLSLILLFLGLFFLLKKKYYALGILSFIYVWTYTGFVTLLIFVLVKFFVDAHDNNYDFRGIFYAYGGVCLGLLINPYFPSNLSTFYTQIFKISFGAAVIGGGEWATMDSWVFIISTLFILVPLVYAMIFTKRKDSKKDSEGRFLLALVFFGLFFFFSARRGVEFFVPLAALFIVYAFKDIYIEKYLKRIIYPVFGLILSLVLLNHMIAMPVILFDSPNYKIQPCAEWLKNNTEKNSVVYNPRWDDFPALFYYDDHNYFVSGLDPNFMYYHNPEKYDLYNKINIGEEFSSKILSEFNATYVVYTIYDESERIKDNSSSIYANSEIAFSDESCYVLKINAE